MEPSCYNCGEKLSLGSKISFRESCPKCGNDLHVCLACEHHDKTAYNECKEPQAERVLDKDRANRCDYFRLGNKASKGKPTQPAADKFKGLDDLFKK